MGIRRQIVLAIVLHLASSSVWAGPEPTSRPASSAQNGKTATAFAKALADGKTDEATKSFDRRMKNGLPADKLASIWPSLEKKNGKFKSFGPPSSTKTGDYESVFIEARFEKSAVRLQIVFNAAGKISGFWIKPAADVSAKPSTPPPYDHPASYTEKAVEFGKVPWTIKGKLTVPRTRALAPVVVLVHGSGPHDDDETIGPNKTFRDIACGLSSNGVAVLRYQKRTFSHQEELMKAGKISVREEVIDDALEALKFVRTQSTIDASRVYLLGHSLGATLAPQIATDDKKLAGIILLSGTPRNYYDVILDQLSYIASLPGPDHAETEKVLKETRETIALARSGKAEADAALLGAPLAYWIDLDRYADASLKQAAALPCKVLICTGGRDYQVTKTDFDLYRKALAGHSNVTFKWYDDLSHLYIRGKGKATPAEYEKAGFFDKRVIDDLVKWISGD